jgi:hypothetical protein
MVNYTTISDFIDPLTRNNVFWFVLSIATLLGGLAAIGYFIEKWMQRKKPDISLKIKTQEEEKRLELEKKKEIRIINNKEWEMIKPYVYISPSYGKEATFFSSPEGILKANKIVTLNGSSLRQIGGKIYKSIEERLTINNQVVKLPDGTYAVASKTFLKRAGLNIGITFPPDIIINSPKDGERVQVSTEISGTGYLEQDQYMWIVTTLLESPGDYWPQGRIDPINGKWNGKISIGNNEDAGKTFNIIVISVIKEDDTKLDNYLMDQRILKKYPGIPLPPSAKALANTRVTRE